MLMTMLDVIKKAAKAVGDASNPVHILYGDVESVEPLSVRINPRFLLKGEALVVPESLKRYEVNLQHNHTTTGGSTGDALYDPVVIRPGLQKGDKVLLIRMQEGQQYVILDKVVDS